MNNYDDWAHLVAKKLKGEADVIAAIGKDELDDAAATEAFVRTVLTPFLPENFSVGSGRIIDAFGTTIITLASRLSCASRDVSDTRLKRLSRLMASMLIKPG